MCIFKKEIFKAIHEGKWLSIEYQNQKNDLTKYWIAIQNIIPEKRIMIVDGLNIGTNQLSELNEICVGISIRRYLYIKR